MRPRPYHDDDAEAVAAFYSSARERDPSIHRVSVAEWRSFARMSFNAGARDFAVVEGDAGLAAVLTSAPAGEWRHFRIIVHPAYRRRGIATRLLRLVEGQGGVPQSNCLESWSAGTAFLEKERFERVFRLLLMECASEPPAPPAHPTLRPYRPGDDDAWIRLHDDGYLGVAPDYTPLAESDLAAHRDAPGFQLWIAERDGDVVGFCHTERTRVNSLVVDRRFRGQGIGRALLLAGMGTAARPVDLSVFADNEAAVGLYRSVGFETTDEMATWRQRVQPTGRK